MLSPALQQFLGEAVLDREFSELLVKNPRKAVAMMDLPEEDRQLAGSIRGASNLVEYAERLLQRAEELHPAERLPFPWQRAARRPVAPQPSPHPKRGHRSISVAS